MVRRIFVLLVLFPLSLFAKPTKVVFPFHAKPDSSARFFYSIGTEWFNFYCYGQTDDGFWNYSSCFLPSSLNMEFRENVLEYNKDHSLSVAFAPQIGVAILATYDEMAQYASLPVFLQYNIGLGSTHRSNRDDGMGFGFGPSINFLNSKYYEFNPSNMISIDFQYTRRRLMPSGKIKFNYIRAGIDPSSQDIPQRGFHFDMGVGRTFGR